MAKNYGKRTCLCLYGVAKRLRDALCPETCPHGGRLMVDMIKGIFIVTFLVEATGKVRMIVADHIPVSTRFTLVNSHAHNSFPSKFLTAIRLMIWVTQLCYRSIF